MAPHKGPGWKGVYVGLSTDIIARVDREAAERGMTKRALYENALLSYLEQPQNPSQEPLFRKTA